MQDTTSSSSSSSKKAIAVTTAALRLVESPGMTVEKLISLRDMAGLPTDELDQMYYDSILTAIEMLTNPMFA